MGAVRKKTPEPIKSKRSAHRGASRGEVRKSRSRSKSKGRKSRGSKGGSRGSHAVDDDDDSSQEGYGWFILMFGTIIVGILLSLAVILLHKPYQNRTTMSPRPQPHPHSGIKDSDSLYSRDSEGSAPPSNGSASSFDGTPSPYNGTASPFEGTASPFDRDNSTSRIINQIMINSKDWDLDA